MSLDVNAEKVAHGHKASFCLEDSDCEPGYMKVYNCANKGDQGISVNCADNYKNTLDCQWIDITDVPYGNYSLRVYVNPLREVAESDWLNNRAVCELHYLNGKVDVRGCSAGTVVSTKSWINLFKFQKTVRRRDMYIHSRLGICDLTMKHNKSSTYMYFNFLIRTIHCCSVIITTKSCSKSYVRVVS